MFFSVELEQIPSVGRLELTLDLGSPQVICIVGKNGSGKTTLSKVLMNAVAADTLRKTTNAQFLSSGSRVTYKFGDDKYVFEYDPTLRTLDTHTPVPQAIKSQLSVELSIPHGQRFNFFAVLAELDDEVRRSIILRKYQAPTGLITFLTAIYGNERFKDLIHVQAKGRDVCCFLLPNNRYIREDYFSSGEYFLINLYRQIARGDRKLIWIDEIDISLDAAAQARLVAELRRLSAQYAVTIAFTSHSLAMMQTLEPGELVYMDREGDRTVLTVASFNFVKSLMFGFVGKDRYILTEDAELSGLLHYLLQRYCPETFHTYSVIEAGGGSQVVGLLRRNSEQMFLAAPDAVIAVLDGDQAKQRHANENSVYCIPIPHVEHAMYEIFRSGALGNFDFPQNILDDGKLLYKAIIRSRKMTPVDIFELICNKHDDDMKRFSEVLTSFLCHKSGTWAPVAVST